jgi:DNA-binding beta-propeller fold protein YncE
VINTLNNTFTKSIPVGSTPVSIGASASGTKVYTANSASNNISVIRTDLDAEITDNGGAPFRLPAPKLDPNCVDPAPPAPPVCTYQSPIHVTR